MNENESTLTWTVGSIWAAGWSQTVRAASKFGVVTGRPVVSDGYCRVFQCGPWRAVWGANIRNNTANYKHNNKDLRKLIPL